MCLNEECAHRGSAETTQTISILRTHAHRSRVNTKTAILESLDCMPALMWQTPGQISRIWSVVLCIKRAHGDNGMNPELYSLVRHSKEIQELRRYSHSAQSGPSPTPQPRNRALIDLISCLTDMSLTSLSDASKIRRYATGKAEPNQASLGSRTPWGATAARDPARCAQSASC